MNIQDARAFEAWYNKNYGNSSLFGSVVTVTEPKLTKKDRVTKEPCPYGKIIKRTTNTVGINYDYHTSKANKLGVEKSDVTVQKPFGTHHVSKLILQKDTDENQYYLSLQYNTANKSKVEYFDGQGNVLQKEDIKGFLPKPSTSELPPVRSPKVESIVKLSIGDYAFSE